MDPNETYRELVAAMAALRDGTADEAAVNRAVDAWDDLDGWMRKSGFLPNAWTE